MGWFVLGEGLGTHLHRCPRVWLPYFPLTHPHTPTTTKQLRRHRQPLRWGGRRVALPPTGCIPHVPLRGLPCRRRGRVTGGLQPLITSVQPHFPELLADVAVVQPLLARLLPFEPGVLALQPCLLAVQPGVFAKQPRLLAQQPGLLPLLTSLLPLLTSIQPQLARIQSLVAQLLAKQPGVQPDLPELLTDLARLLPHQPAVLPFGRWVASGGGGRVQPHVAPVLSQRGVGRGGGRHAAGVSVERGGISGGWELGNCKGREKHAHAMMDKWRGGWKGWAKRRIE